MIPEFLHIVRRRNITVQHPKMGEFKVFPAYVVPEGSEKRIQSARDWGNWDPIRAEKKGKSYSEVTHVPNNVMTEIRLVGVDHRGEGGMAFKVILPDGCYVDLRDDEFWGCFWDGRVDSNTGIIRGHFLWVLNGSQMRLTEMGSPVFQKAKEAHESKKAREKLVKIGIKDLVVGRFYTIDSTNPIKSGTWYMGRVRHEGKKKFAWIDWWPGFRPDSNFSRSVVLTVSNKTLYREVPEPCKNPAPNPQRAPITLGWGRALDPSEYEWL